MTFPFRRFFQIEKRLLWLLMGLYRVGHSVGFAIYERWGAEIRAFVQGEADLKELSFSMFTRFASEPFEGFHARTHWALFADLVKNNVPAMIWLALAGSMIFIWPSVVIFMNGVIGGIVMSVDGVLLYIKRMTPHDTVEFPAMLCLCAVATDFGWRWFRSPWGQKWSLYVNLLPRLGFWLLLSAAAMVLAAFLEAFVRPMLWG